MEEYDFLPPEEERAPKHLEKKWDQEEFEDEVRMMGCPHCSKVIRSDSFFCIYCGEKVVVRAGFITSLLHFFTKKFFGIFLFLLLALGLLTYFL